MSFSFNNYQPSSQEEFANPVSNAFAGYAQGQQMRGMGPQTERAIQESMLQAQKARMIREYFEQQQAQQQQQQHQMNPQRMMQQQPNAQQQMYSPETMDYLGLSPQPTKGQEEFEKVAAKQMAENLDVLNKQAKGSRRDEYALNKAVEALNNPEFIKMMENSSFKKGSWAGYLGRTNPIARALAGGTDEERSLASDAVLATNSILENKVKEWTGRLTDKDLAFVQQLKIDPFKDDLVTMQKKAASFASINKAMGERSKIEYDLLQKGVDPFQAAEMADEMVNMEEIENSYKAKTPKKKEAKDKKTLIAERMGMMDIAPKQPNEPNESNIASDNFPGYLSKEQADFLSSLLPSANPEKRKRVERPLDIMDQAIGLIKGTAVGGGQTLANMGASLVNLIPEGINYATGSEIPSIPYQNWKEENPQTSGERLGQEILGPLGAYAGAAVTGGSVLGAIGRALGMAPEAAAALWASLSPTKKIALQSALSATEGYAINGEDRGTGAVVGGVLGGLGQTGNELYQAAKAMHAPGLAKNAYKLQTTIKDEFRRDFSKVLAEGEAAGANEFLKPIAIPKKLKDANALNAVKNFNESPSLKTAHDAVIQLGDAAYHKAGASGGAVHADTAEHALQLKNRLLQQIRQAFEKSGHDVEDLAYDRLRTDYSKVADFLNNKNVKKFGKGQQTPEQARKLVEVLSKDVNDISQVVDRIPEFQRRMDLSNKGKSLSELVKYGGMGAAGLGGLLYGYDKITGNK